MKRSLARLAAWATLASGVIAPGLAATTADPKSSGLMSGYTNPLSWRDIDKFRNYSDADRAKFRVQALKDTRKLVTAIPLACDITDAAHIAHGTLVAQGKTIEVNAYEIACSNHLGYFIESQGSQPPIAISCFAVDAAHTADLAKGEKNDATCALAANLDVKVTTAALLQEAGTNCAVSEVRWFGLSAPTHTEYTEAACADGAGYLLRIVRTGAAAGVSAVSCPDAAKQGLACRLTNSAPVRAAITEQTYRDALKKNGVACEPTQMRVVGRETLAKRYVVELRCAQEPHGLVAFIPLDDNTSKFEAIDCTAAVARDIPCELTAPPVEGR